MMRAFEQPVMAVRPNGERIYGSTLSQVMATPGVGDGEFQLWIVPGRPENALIPGERGTETIVIVALPARVVAQVVVPAVDAVLMNDPLTNGGRSGQGS